MADWCRRFRGRGLVKTKEILAHGTEESNEFMARFDYVQHLAPWHLEESLKSFNTLKPLKQSGRELNTRHPAPNARTTNNQQPTTVSHWVAIPNFVDTEVFRPVNDETEKRQCRSKFDLPEDAMIIGCVAALKKSHKRIDYLIREFAALSEEGEHSPAQPDTPNVFNGLNSFHDFNDSFLVVAGASQADTNELVALAQELVPGRATILPDVPRERMPALYRTFDVFVLPSLFEMMPIAVLEALASGLPVVTNSHPVLTWMTGLQDNGDDCVEMHEPGALAEYLAKLDRSSLREKGLAARRRAETNFSKQNVISRYSQFYKSVCEIP